MPERYDDDEDDDIPEVEPAPRRRYRRRDLDEDEPGIGEDAGIRMLLPVGRSLWAIASGYLGLVSVLIIPAPFALITGILAIMEMRRNPKSHGMGRAIFGIVMGSIFTIAGIVVAVLILMGKK